MKGKKKVGLLVVLFLVFASFAGYMTYARYIAKGSGSSDVDVAAWSIEIDGTEVTAENHDSVEINKPIIWTNLENYVVSSKAAPGRVANTGFIIDPEGTEVAIDFYVKAVQDGLNENIDVGTVTAGVCSGDPQEGIGTQSACVAAGKTWTPIVLSKVNDEDSDYNGYYKGSLGLPEVEGVKVAMNSTSKVYIDLPLAWTDNYTDPTTTNATASNALDTESGIAGTNEVDGTINFNVAVIQKVAE